MTKVKSLAVVLMTAATLASPAFARSNHVAFHANGARSRVTSDAAFADGSTCVRAPRVGAFASDPWTEPPCEPNTNF
jgi:hypothetical protein